MWVILLLSVIPLVYSYRDEFIIYSQEAVRVDNGQPCLTGCSPDTHQCVINWKRDKRACKILDEPAPIYPTPEYKKVGPKYCVSNCGYFGEKYEWCVTSRDFKSWDYCSSNKKRSTMGNSGLLQGITPYNKTCTDECSKRRDKYVWCHYKDGKEQKWDTCTISALPRIPVLDKSFEVGPKNKGRCSDFFKYNNVFQPPSYSTSWEAADNYVIDIAEAIETVGNTSLTEVYTLNEEGNPVEKYSMVRIRNMMVPAVIRAHVTYDNLKNGSDVKVSQAMDSKLREQMSNSKSSFEGGTLIGFELGGPDAEYNIVPRSLLNWRSDDWVDMEGSVFNWCSSTGGSVDMLVVVFYKDVRTPIPGGFGVSLVFRNNDRSVFVECSEKIYRNDI